MLITTAPLSIPAAQLAGVTKSHNDSSRIGVVCENEIVILPVTENGITYERSNQIANHKQSQYGLNLENRYYQRDNEDLTEN